MSPCTAKLSAYKNKHFLKYVLSSLPLCLTHTLVPLPPIARLQKNVYIDMYPRPAPHADMGEKNRAKPQSLFAKMDAQKKETRPPAATATTATATTATAPAATEESMEQLQEDRI